MTLQVQVVSGDVTAARVDVLAVVVFQDTLAGNPTLKFLERAFEGALLEHAKITEFEGKKEQTLDVPAFGRLKARRLLLVGAGSKADCDGARLRATVASAVRASLGNTLSLGLVLPDCELDLRTVGEGVRLGAYRFTKYFTGERKPKVELERVQIYLPAGKPSTSDRKALALGIAIGEAVCQARDLVNEPPNVLYPQALSEVAQALARRHKLRIKVLDKPGILRAGMNLHYAVGQGSVHEPRFIHLTYAPAGKTKKKLVFVGKGITFDSGGLCIKPAQGMEEMKTDMAGAAAVLGLMAAVAIVKPSITVHGLVGAAENMPDGAAYRPADVFYSLAGKSVEIINTDAEGRLVLADSLAYAARLEPDAIVDAATLTGAVLVALGKTYSAFYASQDALASAIETAARQAGENFWRMPLIEELSEGLKSEVADIKHVADRWGGSIVAALFLKEFVGKTPWVHCDIAGPVFTDRPRGAYPKGATGHPVLTFLRFVEEAAAST